jgi:hypothetical protein
MPWALLLLVITMVAPAVAPGAAVAQGTWTSPSSIDGTTSISAVSCPTSTFCLAVDGNGDYLTYDGTSWSHPHTVSGNSLVGVSCTSATFCLAVDSLSAYIYNGSSWSSPDLLDDTGDIESVSCASPSFCTAVDNTGGIATYDGSAVGCGCADPVDPGQALYSVSCPMSSFCAAVDGSGNVLTYDGSTWSSPTSVDSGQQFSAVSCTEASFCAAVDTMGNAFTYNGSSWTRYPHVDNGHQLDAVSCTNPTFCLAVDQAGNALTYDGSSWSSADAVDAHQMLASVSCANATFCAAVDGDGNALLYTSPPPPVVSDVTPATGFTTGGTTVTLTGSGFTGATAVDFGSTPGTGLNVSNDTSMTVTSPIGSAGPVDITVVTPDGTSPITPADQFVYTVDQTPTVVDCAPTCSATVSSPDPSTVTATGSSGNTSGMMSIVVNTGTLSCGSSYDYATPVTTLSTSGFDQGEDLSVVDTVGDVPSLSTVKVCYAAGSATTGTFLGSCNPSKSNAPCLETLTESAGAVTATFLSPAQDPRFWTGGAALQLKSFTPAKGKPGGKVTIKGKDLSEVQAVVVGGAQATIDAASATKVVITLSAKSIPGVGLITVTAASGEAITTKEFTVT